MAYAPSTDNYSLGRGVVYFDKLNSSGVYLGERDLGNAPNFTFNVALEKLEHFSSRGGISVKDKEIISQLTPGLSFTLDEISKENLNLLVMGEITEVVQTAGTVTTTPETVTARLGMRVVLDHREIGAIWNLPYDGGTSDFVEGETVTGDGGATGVVVAVTGTTASGTLSLIKTNATDFIDGETITGDNAGASGTGGEADVNSTTGGSASTVPNVLVQDSAGTTTYEKGTDYDISTSLKDDHIGRLFIYSTADGGTITDGETLSVQYAYSASTYHTIDAFAENEIEGRLRFVSDNPAGTDLELEVWRVSLAPDGDTALIGENEWASMSFTCEVLKDETNHPDNPYMQITIS
jgi:hypothetical protein